MSLGTLIIGLWVLNAVFFIYALFEKLNTGDNKFVLSALFWFLLNFYATGMYFSSGYSNEQSSPVSANSSSFAAPALMREDNTFVLIDCCGFVGLDSYES